MAGALSFGFLEYYYAASIRYINTRRGNEKLMRERCSFHDDLSIENLDGNSWYEETCLVYNKKSNTELQRTKGVARSFILRKLRFTVMVRGPETREVAPILFRLNSCHRGESIAYAAIAHVCKIIETTRREWRELSRFMNLVENESIYCTRGIFAE